MSTLRVDNLNARTGTTISVPTGTKLYLPGHIIQVLQAVKTDTYVQNSNSFTDIPGIAIAITPSSTSSKILINTFIPTGVDNGYNVHHRLMRDANPICVGAAASTRPQSSWQGFYNTGEDLWPVSIQYLDSPSTTSAVTYKVQIKSGVQCYVNRTSLDRDTTAYDARTAATITVMEVAQ